MSYHSCVHSPGLTECHLCAGTVTCDGGAAGRGARALSLKLRHSEAGRCGAEQGFGSG